MRTEEENKLIDSLLLEKAILKNFETDLKRKKNDPDK